MSVLAHWFIAASAGVVLFLGLVHLLYTFRGSKLHPREPHLIRGIVLATGFYVVGLVAASMSSP